MAVEGPAGPLVLIYESTQAPIMQPGNTSQLVAHRLSVRAIYQREKERRLGLCVWKARSPENLSFIPFVDSMDTQQKSATMRISSSLKVCALMRISDR